MLNDKLRLANKTEKEKKVHIMPNNELNLRFCLVALQSTPISSTQALKEIPGRSGITVILGS